MKVTRKQRSVLPLYLVGAVWVIGAVFFNVNQAAGYVRLALISALVYLIAYAIFPNKMVGGGAARPEAGGTDAKGPGAGRPAKGAGPGAGGAETAQ